MKTISTSDVKKLANLSALTLSDEEAESMQTDLTKILQYFEQLQEVDTKDVEPTYQTHQLESVTRKDVLIDYGISRKELLRNTPNQLDGAVVVPKVLE